MMPWLQVFVHKTDGKNIEYAPAVSERIRQVMGEEWPAYQLFTWGSTYYQHTLVNKLFPLEPQVYSGLPGKFPRWFDPSQKEFV